MTHSAFGLRKRLVSRLCAGLIVFACGLFSAAVAAPQISPTLISTSSSTRAIALESVTMHAEPFSLASEGNFNANDPRTRIEIFCMNLDFLAGEVSTSGNILVGDPNALTVDAEDAAHNHYALKVEYVAQVPPLLDSNGNVTTDFRGLYMVIVRLNDSMTANLGDVLLRLNLHGMASNRVRTAIGAIGGGPLDDPGAVPTPAPGVPPAAVTPLTIAQYQAQFSNPAFPSDQDLRRFLEQASWGGKGDDSDFNHLRAIGIPAYLTEQFNTAPQFNDASDPNFLLASDYPASAPYPQFYPASPPAPPCDATCLRDFYTLYPLQKQFMLNALTQQDQLRQRVSFAFHKFIVVGGQPLNNNQAFWYAPYLQTIDRNSFGNFRTMLFEVTLNPGMGEYLNMRGNSVVNRANPTPNENYAREIMQLFSIGVDTLNQNGTPVLDAQGNRVPSYDQTTIANLARVFTGWDLGPNKQSAVDGTFTVANYLDPMVPNGNANRYDIAAKTLLTDINHPASAVVIPACANCVVNGSNNLANTQAYAIASLNTAIDNLFNNPNTGPYVCTQLIHQMVTSNPAPAYVGRCSAAFANNGSGVRGDMKAVITAILLDPESRGDLKTDPNYGHMREPVLLMTHLLRAFNATTDGVLVTSTGGSFSTPLGQNVFNPPTVFSYFPADFGLPGTSLFGPEFGVLDTSTTYARANFMNTLFVANNGNGIPASGVNRPTGTQINFATYQALANNPTGQQLVDALNTKLMHGSMSAAMNANIVATVNAIPSGASQALQRTQTAIYLVASSAQYQVER